MKDAQNATPNARETATALLGRLDGKEIFAENEPPSDFADFERRLIDEYETRLIPASAKVPKLSTIAFEEPVFQSESEEERLPDELTENEALIARNCAVGIISDNEFASVIDSIRDHVFAFRTSNDDIESPYDVMFSADLLRVLNEQFRHSAFRPRQLEIILQSRRGHDVFVCLATGAGKSLLYQLPAAIEDGVAVVFSPLVALISDQQHANTTIGVSSRVLPGCLKDSLQCVADIIARRTNAPKILFLTPERFAKSAAASDALEKLFFARRLTRFVIDEAHCISEWGHDFRRDYLKLGRLRTRFPGVPIVALSATCTPATIYHTLQKTLMGPSTLVFRENVDRPNLFYIVARKRPGFGPQLISALRRLAGQCGIVYCASVKACEQHYSAVCAVGIKATFYHAQLEREQRDANQELWMSGAVELMICTVAFGMGINKRNVRFVIHAAMPRSLEALKQESGRAGRDGLPATCLLFYAPHDRRIHEHFLARSDSVFTRKKGLIDLAHIERYCLTTQCRRAVLLQHFQRETVKCEEMCDNCARSANPTPPADCRKLALLGISLCRERVVTIAQLAAMICLRGSVARSLAEGTIRECIRIGIFKPELGLRGVVLSVNEFFARALERNSHLRLTCYPQKE